MTGKALGKGGISEAPCTKPGSVSTCKELYALVGNLGQFWIPDMPAQQAWPMS